MLTKDAKAMLVAVGMGVGAAAMLTLGAGCNPKMPTSAPDLDGDGVPDAVDKCPGKKEDGLDPDPKDGCPKG